MFKNLKEKLKNWVSKSEEKEDTTPEIVEKKSKKEKKTKKKDTTKKNKKKPEKEKEKPVKKVRNKKISEERFNELFDELELILLQNNVALEVIENLRDSLKEKVIVDNQNIEEALKESIREILQDPPNLIEQIKNSLKEKKPYVILFAGINGAGKTTTLAKIANYLQKQKFSLCFAAADTFRAASIEQLETHAQKLKIPVIKKDYGADPASVGFDAINYAKKNKIDIVLIDTAGRMNNRDSLMKEIEKISRVNKPDLKILLAESTTGNDATIQAKDFNEAIKLDGIILSKADVDEKGGTAISVSFVTKKPILFLGTGQTYEDLEPFEKEKLIDKIFN
jgi:fused signal recognition particle receptor